MSASTVSIRAASRRRPVLSTDRNNNTTAASSVELLGFDTITTTTANNANKNSNRGQENGDVAVAGGGDEKRVKKSSSLLLERSRDGAVQVKDSGLRDDVVSPRRAGNRVSGNKKVKPWWMTVLSVFVKNFVLLLVVLGFVHLIYRLAVRIAGGEDVGIVSGSGSGAEAVVELEGRLSELEKTWKKTTKLMQVQVEVVDRKVGNEVAGLKEELSKRIEEKSEFLGYEMRKLDGKVETLENALGQLTLDEFLTKEEFERFYEKLKKTGSGDKELSLDEVRAYAREVVEREIEKHAADGLGRVDYALASGGGMVVKHSEPFRVGKWGWTKKSVLNAVHEQAMRILRPSFGEPGQCFPLKGSSGFVQIRLRTAIVTEAITLEHVAKSVAYDRSSAPKNCRIYGWLQGPEPSLQDNAENMILLSEFTYDLDKSSAQTFSVSDSASEALVNMVRLDFFSNHGSPSHTCIYRLRVHGQEPKSVPTPHAVAP